ncbi:DEAD/DEAH box helicase [Phenylobacterium sp. NIBR 498073]|uniref:DEAD/DEAH box helicase n=1 Tax=Phenylobacterium sp. NIBR 498073 TaxID=3015177 RepID=UPI0022B4559A|nr:DEAD/DEAH box helicase [Phenylobacterium sp. NIBR 498073]MBS0488902.1 DEAD/DEAH box helicase [Pseudomonadota bacterium]WGU39334.1 DEAD/DEAH box helicase [Phenylobacterium sp. NIBR 498073]
MAFPNIHPALARALASQGYEEPTPVQAAVLTEEAEGRDLLVSAQTGSGKTVAFGLAAGPTLLGEEQWFGQAGPPLALAIAPTRELAMQVARELSWLYGQAGAKVETCVGGMDPRREQRALAAGCHILVGTPGRLKDHLERGNLDLGALRVLVLDEADEMLDMGFREDLEEILDSSPVDRRTLLFSATIAKDIAALAKRYQRNALRIDTVRRDEPHGDIEYRAVRVAPNEVELAVVNVLRFFEAPGALVFCNTRDGVRHMHAALRERGFQVVGLSGELGQRERSEALQALRDGHARVCVATDVAARGLDLPDLGLVIHADLPINKPALLHRSGRTGRAGKKGTSVLLVPYTRRRKAEQLLASAGVDVHWQGPPTADEIKAKDQARMLEDPILTEEPAEEDLALARLVLETRSAEQVAAALMRLYRQRLPAPEELYDDARMRDAQARDRERPQRGDRWEPSDRDDGPVGRPPRLAPEDVSWFRITVGRAKNADPKWLIPMICRLGHITKKDIGSIRIFDRETKFEISKEAEAKFAAAVKATADDEIQIEASSPPGAAQPRGPHRKGPPAGDGKPFRKGPPGEGKPFRKGPPREGGKPAFKGPPGAPGPKGGKPPWKKKGVEQRK